MNQPASTPINTTIAINGSPLIDTVKFAIPVVQPTEYTSDQVVWITVRIVYRRTGAKAPG